VVTHVAGNTEPLGYLAHGLRGTQSVITIFPCRHKLRGGTTSPSIASMNPSRNHRNTVQSQRWATAAALGVVVLGALATFAYGHFSHAQQKSQRSEKLLSQGQLHLRIVRAHMQQLSDAGAAVAVAAMLGIDAHAVGAINHDANADDANADDAMRSRQFSDACDALLEKQPHWTMAMLLVPREAPEASRSSAHSQPYRMLAHYDRLGTPRTIPDQIEIQLLDHVVPSQWTVQSTVHLEKMEGVEQADRFWLMVRRSSSVDPVHFRAADSVILLLQVDCQSLLKTALASSLPSQHTAELMAVNDQRQTRLARFPIDPNDPDGTASRPKAFAAVAATIGPLESGHPGRMDLVLRDYATGTSPFGGWSIGLVAFLLTAPMAFITLSIPTLLAAKRSRARDSSSSDRRVDPIAELEVDLSDLLLATWHQTNAPMAVIGLTGMIKQANAPLAQMLRTETSSILGRSVFQFMEPSESAQGERRWLRSSDEGPLKVQQLEHCFIGVDGAMIAATVNLLPIGEEGCRGLLAIFRPKNEDRPSVQSTAQDAWSIRRPQVRHLPSSIAVLDQECSIQSHSHRFAELFGVAGTDLDCMQLSQALPRMPKEWPDLLRTAIRTGKMVEGSEQLQFADDTRAWIQWQAHPLPRDGQHPPGLLLTVENTTAWQETARLLREAREEAESASRIRRELLSMISHELRTPLHGILGTIEILRASINDLQQHQCLDSCELSGRTLLALVNDILELVRLESSPNPSQTFAYFHLDALLTEVRQSIEPRLRAKQLECRLETPREGLEVLGDRNQLSRLLHRLLSSAIDCTPEGTIKLQVESASTGDGKVDAELRVLIEDGGPATTSATIVQGDAIWQMSHRHDGRDLGLAVAARTMQSIGGTIELENTAGGVRSKIAIPWPSRKCKSTNLAIAPAAKVVQPAPSNLRGRKVLVAEDNAVNRLYVTHTLKRLGIDFDVVGDGKQAVESFSQGTYDAILMDCQMPVMDGLTACRTIREKEKSGGLSRIPIIALTANALDGDLQACLESGMDQSVGKPFTALQLADALSTALRERAGPSQADARGADASIAAAEIALDRNLLLLQCGGDENFADELIETAMTTFPTRVDELRRAIEEGSAKQAGEAAHAIKGGAGIICAAGLQRVAGEMELAANHGTIEELKAIMLRLDAAFARLMEGTRSTLAVEPNPTDRTYSTVSSIALSGQHDAWKEVST
jgi:CheY-like chemotaxis protein/HPt (histidine-containing phosphotransfer) domain-containing protein